MLLSGIKKIVFTSDILRVDDTSSNLMRNPQFKNIDWLYEIFNPIFSNIMNSQARKILLDTPPPRKIYYI